ncbi:MAG: HlyD family efflux transporter periplasmic adaptor subunit [Gammaproteobacteria bacterium]|nr:HlyD family efflux transporter periplasmic adaptor subunit [Gammaproteobacteria bacterium]
MLTIDTASNKNKIKFLLGVIALLIGFFLLGLFLFFPSKKTFTGYTDTLYVYLAAPTMGYVEHKWVDRGAPFKKGDRLLALSAEPDISQLEQANAFLGQTDNTLLDLERPRRRPEREAIKNQIKQVQASIDRVTLFYNRLLKLASKQFVAQDTIDTNRKMIEELHFQKKALEENLKLSKMGARSAQIASQQQAVKAAKAKIIEYSWYLEHKKIKAPADGYVFDIFYNLGDFVAAQKPVMSVVLPKNNYIEFFVSAKEMIALNLNQIVHFHYFNDKQMKDAKIFYISQTVEYMPPILFTQSSQQELVFRVRARPLNVQRFVLGQAIEVIL